MSAYGKSQTSQGYDTGRTYQENSYSYPAPPYVHQPSLSSSTTTTTPSYQHATQMTSMEYGSGDARSSFDDHSGPYLAVGAASIPEVVSYAPIRGNGGTKIFVNISSLYDLMTTSLPTFFLVFGQRKCQASIAKMAHQQGASQYTVTAEIPQFAVTGSSSPHVTVYMLLETSDGELMGRVDVGQFSYVDDGRRSGSNTPLDNSRKRKSSDSAELGRGPIKRVSTQNLRQRDDYSPYSYTTVDAGSYSPYLTPTAQYGGLANHYSRSTTGYPQSSRPSSYGYSTSAAGLPLVKAETSPSWNTGYTTYGSNIVKSPAMPSNAPINRTALSGLPSPAPANPTLIRISSIQQTPSPATTPHGMVGHQYSTYSLYPHKAQLDIKGDLKSMRDDWTDEEWRSKRRLVQFKRSQSGSTITTTFQPVSLEDRPQNSVCVSCIYWEEKRDYFITSVDTIYLLEQLVAARFTVEEKNRIRRNLEGLKPVTVCKGKADSEEFFKVIMGFPTPKPRNIEKDVKVFHWDDLSNALKKIIGKYCASPSSTISHAPSLLTPISSTGYVTENPSASVSYASDHHGAISPRSLGSNTSAAYTSSAPTRALSPHDPKSMMLQSGPPDLRLSVPQSHEPTGHWQGGQHHMPNTQSPYHHYGAQSARTSWDISSYLDNSSATAAGTSSGSHALNYQTSSHRSISDPSGSADENRNIGSLSSQQESHQTHQV
ncbi:hypothetical protein PVAG01_08307 [Phlyctema vagabunda]|uniref:DUF7082 domain-containing protein n=1 Tax=Phlyctema vagabunda TaxID=108571 RepID=A0ABR4P930_9HELO